MKLSLDLIATALENNMFDQKVGKHQGLIFLVNENCDGGKTKVGKLLVGDEDAVGMAIVRMMQNDPNVAAIILTCAEMYNRQTSLPDFDTILSGLDKAISALEEVCEKSGKNRPSSKRHRRDKKDLN